MTMSAAEEERRRAFELGVARETRRLYALAFSLLHDVGEAEDAVQETFLSAWRALPSLRQPDRQAAWLTRICVTRCISQRRLRRRRSLPVSRAAGTELAGPEVGEPYGSLLALEGALRSLPARQRAMFVLHLGHGFTVNECAEFLGCRPGTARSHLGRAISRVRRQLSDA